jgi:hypothetical protein
MLHWRSWAVSRARSLMSQAVTSRRTPSRLARSSSATGTSALPVAMSAMVSGRSSFAASRLRIG